MSPTVRTITMTGRPPVRIEENAWPTIASASYVEHNGGEHEFQASRSTRASIRVRQHSDGRSIVYATCRYLTQWAGEGGSEYRAGCIVPADGDIVLGVYSVTDTMGDYPPTHYPVDWRLLADQCIADLPPVTL